MKIFPKGGSGKKSSPGGSRSSDNNNNASSRSSGRSSFGAYDESDISFHNNDSAVFRDTEMMVSGNDDGDDHDDPYARDDEEDHNDSCRLLSDDEQNGSEHYDDGLVMEVDTPHHHTAFGMILDQVVGAAVGLQRMGSGRGSRGGYDDDYDQDYNPNGDDDANDDHDDDVIFQAEEEEGFSNNESSTQTGPQPVTVVAPTAKPSTPVQFAISTSSHHSQSQKEYMSRHSSGNRKSHSNRSFHSGGSQRSFQSNSGGSYSQDSNINDSGGGGGYYSSNHDNATNSQNSSSYMRSTATDDEDTFAQPSYDTDNDTFSTPAPPRGTLWERESRPARREYDHHGEMSSMAQESTAGRTFSTSSGTTTSFAQASQEFGDFSTSITHIAHTSLPPLQPQPQPQQQSSSRQSSRHSTSDYSSSADPGQYPPSSNMSLIEGGGRSTRHSKDYQSSDDEYSQDDAESFQDEVEEQEEVIYEDENGEVYYDEEEEMEIIEEEVIESDEEEQSYFEDEDNVEYDDDEEEDDDDDDTDTDSEEEDVEMGIGLQSSKPPPSRRQQQQQQQQQQQTRAKAQNQQQQPHRYRPSQSSSPPPEKLPTRPSPPAQFAPKPHPRMLRQPSKKKKQKQLPPRNSDEKKQMELERMARKKKMPWMTVLPALFICLLVVAGIVVLILWGVRRIQDKRGSNDNNNANIPAPGTATTPSPTVAPPTTTAPTMVATPAPTPAVRIVDFSTASRDELVTLYLRHVDATVTRRSVYLEILLPTDLPATGNETSPLLLYSSRNDWIVPGTLCPNIASNQNTKNEDAPTLLSTIAPNRETSIELEIPEYDTTIALCHANVVIAASFHIFVSPQEAQGADGGTVETYNAVVLNSRSALLDNRIVSEISVPGDATDGVALVWADAEENVENIQLVLSTALTPQADIETLDYNSSGTGTRRFLAQVGDNCPSTGYLTPERQAAPVWVMDQSMLNAAIEPGATLVACDNSVIVQIGYVTIQGLDEKDEPEEPGPHWDPVTLPVDPGFYGVDFVLLQNPEEGGHMVGIVEPWQDCVRALPPSSNNVVDDCVFPRSLSGPKLYQSTSNSTSSTGAGESSAGLSWTPSWTNPAPNEYVRAWSSDASMMVTTTATASTVQLWQHNENTGPNSTWTAVGQILEGWPTLSSNGKTIVTITLSNLQVYRLDLFFGELTWIPKRPNIDLKTSRNSALLNEGNVFTKQEKFFADVSVALSFDGNGMALAQEDAVRMYKFSAETDLWESMGGDLLLADALPKADINGNGDMNTNGNAVTDLTPPTNWTTTDASAPCHRTTSVAMSHDGRTMVVGSRAVGVVAVYRFYAATNGSSTSTTNSHESSWELLGTPWTIQAQDCWGHKVALSADGNILATGASGQIQVFRWNQNTNSWVSVSSRLVPGRFFALAPDGKSLAVKTRRGEIELLNYVPS